MKAATETDRLTAGPFSGSVAAPFRRKPLRELERDLQAAETSSLLPRVLGPAALIFFGVGGIIGAGIFGIIGEALAQAGPSLPLSFLFVAACCALVGLAYCELATAIPVAGSCYTYCYVYFGELAAVLMGWNAVLEYMVGASVVARAWAAYLASFVETAGGHLPDELVRARPGGGGGGDDGASHGAIFVELNATACAVVVLAAAIGCVRVDLSTRVNAGIVVIKLAVLLLFVAVAFATRWDTANLEPFAPHGAPGVLRAGGTVFFAFIGFDGVATLAEETAEPQRALPRGILGSLGVSTAVYVVVAIALAGAVRYDADDATLEHPLSAALKPSAPWASAVVAGGAVFGILTALITSLAGAARVVFGMARDGFLPAPLAQVSTRTATPVAASVATGGTAALIAFVLPMSVLAHLTSIGAAFAFVSACLAVLLRRYTDVDAPPDAAAAPSVSVVKGSALVMPPTRAAGDGGGGPRRPSAPLWRLLALTLSLSVGGSVCVQLGLPWPTYAAAWLAAAITTIAYRRLPAAPPRSLRPGAFVCPGLPLVPLVGIATTLHMVIAQGALVIAAYAGWTLLGVVGYVISRRRALAPLRLAV